MTAETFGMIYGVGAATWLVVGHARISALETENPGLGWFDARVGYTAALFVWPIALLVLTGSSTGRIFALRRARKLREAEERKRWLEAPVDDIVRRGHP